MALTNVVAPIAPGPMVHAIAFGASAQTFNPPSRAVFCATAGSITVTMNGDASPVTFSGILAGTWLDISIISLSAGATSAGVVLW